MFLNHKGYITDRGGATFEVGIPIQHTSGYQVGTLDGTEYTSGNLNELLLLADIMDLKNCGFWYSEASQLWYLDTSSVHIKDRTEAERIGRANNQKAIFDWSTQEEITL